MKTDREYRAINLLLPATENRRIDSKFYVEGIACTFNDPYLMYDDGQR